MSKGGPKSPPAEYRFRKGESGNPKGRPKKSRTDHAGSAFDIIVDRTLTVTRGGVQREVTVEEALQHSTYQAALAGNRSARREVLKMIAKREKWLAERDEGKGKSIETRLEPEDPGNANQALLILGIACRDPRYSEGESKYERLLLEPWAVQAALSRRRGGSRLSEKEKAEVIRCTRDADTIRWPRSAE